jgi:hypothetical protein
MDVVYATSTASIAAPAGNQVPIRAGQHWPADDPIVLAHPGLFSADPRYGLVFSERPDAMDEPPIEQATSAPGEKRARVQRG